MHFHIITLFPESFDSYINTSILKRAQTDGKIKIHFYDLKDFTEGKKSIQKGSTKRADDRPYGGGPGMVLRAEPVVKAIAQAKGRKKDVLIIFTSPRGKQFNNAYAQKIEKKYKHVIFVCGRYEGIDARVKKIFKMEDISIGPYVLTGGELPAMVMMDTISRQVEGVLGALSSLEEKRIAGKDVYTRPAEFLYKGKTYKVPEVLLSGHHGNIDSFREEKK